MNQETKNVLRWIAVPFAAILGALLFYALIRISIWLGQGYVGKVFFVNQFIIDCIAEATTGIGFVYAGSLAAPSSKRTTSIVLCSIFSTLCLVSILFIACNWELMSNPAWYVVGTIAAIIGAIYGAYKFSDEKYVG